jgi:hypothetical protein
MLAPYPRDLSIGDTGARRHPPIVPLPSKSSPRPRIIGACNHPWGDAMDHKPDADSIIADMEREIVDAVTRARLRLREAGLSELDGLPFELSIQRVLDDDEPPVSMPEDS